MSWARVYQETLPSLEARAQSARARADQAGDYFAGKLVLEAAFPQVAGAPLDSRAWLSAQRARLDSADAARVAERTAAPTTHPELAAWQRQQLQRALLATLDAEDAADQLERRLYLGLGNLLDASPGLERRALAAPRAELEAALQAATVALEAAGKLPVEAQEAALAAARADAAAAADQQQRLEKLVSALRAHSTTGTPTPDPAEDLTALDAGGDAARWATHRLGLLRPFLSPEALAQFYAAEVAQLEALLPTLQAARDAAEAKVAALKVTPPPAVVGTEAELVEALKTAKAARTALVKPATAEGAEGTEGTEGTAGTAESTESTAERTVKALRAEQASLQRAIADANVAAAELRITLAEAAREDATTSAEMSRTLAEETRREADVAQTQAASATQRVQAELLNVLAVEQEAGTTTWTAVNAAQEVRKTRLSTLKEALLQADTDSEVALRKGALDVSRQAELDKIYHDLRSQIGQLRKEVSTANSDLLDARRALSKRQEEGQALRADFLRRVQTLGEAADPELSGRLDTAQSERSRALADAVTQIEVHRDERLHLLRNTRDLRRKLRPEISSEVAAEDQRYLLEDIRQEFKLLGPYLATLVQDRLEWGIALPGHLLDFRWIRSLVLGSVWLFVVGIIWFWSRRQVSAQVKRALAMWTARAPLWQRRDLSGLAEPGADAVRALIDVALGYALAGPLGDSFPELGLLLLIYLQVATFRLAMGVFDLAIAQHPATRPAVKVLAPELWELASRTVRYGLLWFIARQFTSYVAREVMGTDVLHDVLMTGFSVVFLLLTVALLHRWEPHLRPHLSRVSLPDSLRFLKTPPSSGLLRAPRALLSGLLLTGHDLWNLLDMRTSERSPINRLLNWITRRQLAGDDQTPAWSPPEALRNTLLAEDCADEWYVERPTLDNAFQEAFNNWKEQRRRGRVVLVGDRGQGKHSWLTRLCAAMTTDGWEVTRVSVNRRLMTTEDALVWLSEIAGLTEVPESAEAMEEALCALPPRIWVVEDLERAFLRKVRGFDALEILMSILQRASSQHFWVLAVHRPAWRYLTRLRALFDTQVFPTVLELTPLGEADLRKLVRARTDAAGWSVTFRSDTPGGTESEAALEQERSERRFFRLLGEASEGNTAVALTMWSGCMVPGDSEKEIGARFRENPAARLPPELDDADLFVLAAARIQERLNEDELVEVTRLPPGIVRASLRSLVESGVLEPRENHFAIPISHLPAVTRMLRRRHLVP